MTNLEKLKSEIADMSADEFAHFLSCPIDSLTAFSNYCEGVSDDECNMKACASCRVKWLNAESDEK